MAQAQGTEATGAGLGAPAQVAALRAVLRTRIAAAGGRISFAEYMDLALYHPRYGYYSAGVVALGPAGDFTTSPEVDPAFGALLATFVRRCDAALAHPPAFLLAEHGAGSGRLLSDLLDALRAEARDLYERLVPVIVERSPALRARQEALLAAAGHVPPVRWAAGAAPGAVGADQRVRASGSGRVVGADQRVRPVGTGLVFSNELLDAFPVHRVVATAAGWEEIYVAVDAAGGLVEERGPLSDPALAQSFAAAGIHPPLGQPCEVNLRAPAWLHEVAAGLERGFVLTIDYGDRAERLYSALRPEGTLLCYSGGRVSADPYLAPGAQDMTAHVDFTALERAGVAAGLETVAATRQMEFLVGLGIGDRLAALRAEPAEVAADPRARAAGRARLFRLIDPDGLGRFHVLVQAKNVARERWPAVLPRM